MESTEHLRGRTGTRRPGPSGQPSGLSRRSFLEKAGVTVAAIGAPLSVPANVLAARGKTVPSDRVILGVIGTGRRAQWLIRTMPEEGQQQGSAVRPRSPC